MSSVSRSTFQKVCEENKRLKRDLKLITSDGRTPEKVLLIGKWRKHFEEQEKQNRLIRELILIAQERSRE